jgi:hypothetical protein
MICWARRAGGGKDLSHLCMHRISMLLFIKYNLQKFMFAPSRSAPVVDIEAQMIAAAIQRLGIRFLFGSSTSDIKGLAYVESPLYRNPRFAGVT